MTAVTDIVFDPWLPVWMIAAVVAPGLILAGVAAVRGIRGQVWRVAFLTIIGLALMNPAITEEDRRPVDSVAVIVADQSISQGFGDRTAQRDTAVAALRDAAGALPGFAVRVVEAGGDTGNDTRVFGDLATTLADIPRAQLAGVIVVSDGQIHDAPTGAVAGVDAPVHAVITGSRDAVDQRVSFVDPPAFGLVNQSIQVLVAVHQYPEAPIPPTAPVTIRRDGDVIAVVETHGDGSALVNVPLIHGGQTVIEAEIPVLDGELTAANNRAAFTVNGVRDRLRVLLVSGEPHMGERVWRNILKSDPSVDLVHFTILRPPEGQDGTPINELSLIAFPVRELFDTQINEFDLIIFDRYRRRGVLHQAYLENIARYVEGGGAFLEASGPDFADVFSLYRTPLERILPGRPTGAVVERGFQPVVTDLGDRHPVTSGLDGAGQNDAAPDWGRWFRQIDIVPTSGDTLMTGADDRPLLMLDRVGQGRVAQIASDQMWLWARGFEGGGPQVEILRRVAHWLMGEPSLEENLLTAASDGEGITITRRILEGAAEGEVTLTRPDGAAETVTLRTTAPGVAEAQVNAPFPGIYQIDDQDRRALVVVGALSPPELTDVQATAERLANPVMQSGGGVVWVEDGVPTVRAVRPGRDAAGTGWLGLVDRQQYQVIGNRQTAMLPPGLAIVLLLIPLILGWRAEGR